MKAKISSAGEQATSMSLFRAALLGKVAADLAHEMSTPLSIISLLASHIEAAPQGLPKEALQKLMTDIQENVHHVAGILRRIQEFSTDASTEPVLRTPILFVLQDSLKFWADRLKLKNFEVKLNCPENFQFEGRKTELLQTFIALINYCMDSLMSSPLKEISIKVIENSKKDSKCFEIQIQVSGNSPEAESIEFQVSKQLIEKYQGTLVVTRRPGGSDLCVTLPQHNA